jgi:two-component system, LytTR family, response regulator LytT
MTLSALIIDDEQLARDELKYLLDQVGGVEVWRREPTASRPWT